MNDAIRKAKDFLFSRRQAYVAVFDNPQGDKVLKDLAKFCRAHESTVHKDQRMTDILEGRREVWLRIQHHLKLKEDDLWELYGGQKEPR